MNALKLALVHLSDEELQELALAIQTEQDNRYRSRQDNLEESEREGKS